MENKMLDLLKTRRSVRAYRPEQITPEELAAVTEAGTWAPTGMGLQSPVIVADHDAGGPCRWPLLLLDPRGAGDV